MRPSGTARSGGDTGQKCLSGPKACCQLPAARPGRRPPTIAQRTRTNCYFAKKSALRPCRDGGLAAAHSHGRERLNAGAILVLSTGKTDVTAARWVQPVPEARGFRISFRETREAR
ncbi:hypothetical protein CKAH01_05192 [Colletotrichum kahawae]|uniref:Uncharacterized protein n=1 Tax=Colletotrichum kahawae TaxID=34407 RepID=A0AAD9YGI4_COLKA|nr:hypothetical protein CKAH01_05192 [Colletotrichum kahawae]